MSAQMVTSDKSYDNFRAMFAARKAANNLTASQAGATSTACSAQEATTQHAAVSDKSSESFRAMFAARQASGDQWRGGALAQVDDDPRPKIRSEDPEATQRAAAGSGSGENDESRALFAARKAAGNQQVSQGGAITAPEADGVPEYVQFFKSHPAALEARDTTF